jgi:hypothetical protein
MIVEAHDRRGAALALSYAAGQDRADAIAAAEELGADLTAQGLHPASYEVREGYKVLYRLRPPKELTP